MGEIEFDSPIVAVLKQIICQSGAIFSCLNDASF